MMKKKTFSLLLAAAVAAASLAGCGKSEDFTANMSEEEKAAWEAAASDPYGKYPELVTYTTGYALTAQALIPLQELLMKTTPLLIMRIPDT